MIDFGNIKTKAGINYMTEAEEKTLFSFLKNRKDKQSERDYALLKLCRATALRRAEALSLNMNDIANTDKIIIDERIAKKGGVGVIYLSVETQEILKKFLRLKRKWKEGLETGDPLFLSKKGHRLSARSFNDLLKKWCFLSRIPQFTPHSLRHTKLQRIMADFRNLSDTEQGKRLLFANKQARHKSLNSTLVYLQPTKEEMQKVAGI